MGRDRTQRKQPKGASQQPKLVFLWATPLEMLILLRWVVSSQLHFLKTAFCWMRDAPISTSRRATSVQCLLPHCGTSFPESAKRTSQHLQGPEPQGYFSSTHRAGEGFAAFVLQTQLTLVVLLSWQTAHKKQTWSSLYDGKVWWQDLILSPCTLERWEG